MFLGVKKEKKRNFIQVETWARRTKYKVFTKKVKSLLHYKKEISCIDEEDEQLHNETVLPPESADRDIATDEEGNYNQWSRGRKQYIMPNTQ